MNSKLRLPFGMAAKAEDPDDDRPFLNQEGFLRTFVNYQRKAALAFQENGGFSHEEVKELRERFMHFDADKSGEISKKELIALIEEFFPNMAHDQNNRTQLKAMMKQVDEDGSGSLDFRDFIRLMDQLREVEHGVHMDKFNRAMKDSGFSQREVDEFRELFLTTSEGSNTLQTGI